MSLEANSVHISPRYCLLNSAYFKHFIEESAGNFAVSSFVGFSIEENIHESESTRTLLAKASKLNMYIHNIHLHIFSIKLISPVIAVYKQTVFPISLRASLCKILISSFAHKMDFANNFFVDFF